MDAVMSQRAPTPFPGPFSFRKQKQQKRGTFHFWGVSRLAEDTNYCYYHTAEYKTSKTGRDIMWRQTVRRDRLLGNYQSGTSRLTTTFFSLWQMRWIIFQHMWFLRDRDLRAESRLATKRDAGCSKEGRVSSWGKTKVTQCHLVGCAITVAACSTWDNRPSCQWRKQLYLHVGEKQTNC